MPLDTEVVPAMLTLLKTVTQADGVTPLLKGVTWGESLSLPASPWAFLVSSRADFPDYIGPDREGSTWTFNVRLIHSFAADGENAEAVLATLVEPIRAAFRAHIKMGTSTIILAKPTGATWGYILLNNIACRVLDLAVQVKEKIVVSYAA